MYSGFFLRRRHTLPPWSRLSGFFASASSFFAWFLCLVRGSGQSLRR
jgi:hypothetical protein